MEDGGPCMVRHFSVREVRGLQGTVGDCGGLRGTTEDYWGLRWTAVDCGRLLGTTGDYLDISYILANYTHHQDSAIKKCLDIEGS